ncbi:MAG: sigma-70 family RNA polymerase sigma factor [Planctomycetota bacterium]|nr:MAG: sigma-70 family RNA polymerase sigma factor [Planctomycetota bacterium]
MDPKRNPPNPETVSAVWGPPTSWSLIRQAAGNAAEDRTQLAWEELVDRYRAPAEKSLRRMIRNHPDTEEIVHDFFAYLYEKRLLPKADPKLGKFRCFIQGVIRNFARQRLRANRSWSHAGENVPEPGVLPGSPEFERLEELEWANGVLHNAVGRLLKAQPRDAELLLRCYGVAPFPETPRQALCQETGLTMNALNVAVHRARERLRTLVIDEIRQTVATAGDMEEEVQLVCERLIGAHPGLMDD